MDDSTHSPRHLHVRIVSSGRAPSVWCDILAAVDRAAIIAAASAPRPRAYPIDSYSHFADDIPTAIEHYRQ